MKTIYKYPLHIVDEQTIEIQEHAELLHVGLQNDELFLWALVSYQFLPLAPTPFFGI